MKRLFIFLMVAALAGCANDTRYTNEYIIEEGQCQNAEEYYRPKTDTEIQENEKKWNTSRMETRWQEYKGTMIRVQVLLGNSDMREMRLRLMQGANGGDIDGDYRSILSYVADFEMKKVCGRNAESYVIVYDNPAFDAMRPTPYFDYRIEAEGSTMREYGFTCVYGNN